MALGTADGLMEGAELGCPVNLISKLSSPLKTLGLLNEIGSPLKSDSIPTPS
jgi:hypothetical protein